MLCIRRKPRTLCLLARGSGRAPPRRRPGLPGRLTAGGRGAEPRGVYEALPEQRPSPWPAVRPTRARGSESGRLVVSRLEQVGVDVGYVELDEGEAPFEGVMGQRVIEWGPVWSHVGDVYDAFVVAVWSAPSDENCGSVAVDVANHVAHLGDVPRVEVDQRIVGHFFFSGVWIGAAATSFRRAPKKRKSSS